MYIKAKVTDNEDGTYLVKYKVPEPCKCEINIKFLDEDKEEAIRGNRFVSSFVNKGNPKTSNEFDGPILQSYITSQMSEITKFLDHTKDSI